MTFSLAARCPRTGMFGIAIASADIAAGGRCAFAKAAVGAVLTQHRADPRLGPLGIGLLEQGRSVQATIDALVVAATPHHDWRQLAVIDRGGGTAHYSGGSILSLHGAAVRPDAVAIGNDLQNAAVPQAEVDGFAEDSRPHLAERLMRALEAGLEAGGTADLLRSAALLVVHRQPFPLVDLRIDDDPDPVAALRRLWRVFEPRMEEFLVRAIAPGRTRRA